MGSFVPLFLITRVESQRMITTVYSNYSQSQIQNPPVIPVCLHSPKQNSCSRHPFLTLSHLSVLSKMKESSFEHVYDCNWDRVTSCFWRKYCNALCLVVIFRASEVFPFKGICSQSHHRWGRPSRDEATARCLPGGSLLHSRDFGQRCFLCRRRIHRWPQKEVPDHANEESEFGMYCSVWWAVWVLSKRGKPCDDNLPEEYSCTRMALRTRQLEGGGLVCRRGQEEPLQRSQRDERNYPVICSIRYTHKSCLIVVVWYKHVRSLEQFCSAVVCRNVWAC